MWRQERFIQNRVKIKPKINKKAIISLEHEYFRGYLYSANSSVIASSTNSFMNPESFKASSLL